MDARRRVKHSNRVVRGDDSRDKCACAPSSTDAPVTRVKGKNVVVDSGSGASSTLRRVATAPPARRVSGASASVVATVSGSETSFATSVAPPVAGAAAPAVAPSDEEREDLEQHLP